MGIHLTWITDNLLRFQFDHEWTWEEYHTVAGESLKILNQSGHVIHFLVDFRARPHVLASTITHFHRAATLNHPNRGLIFMLSPDMFWRTVGESMTRLYPKAAQNVRIIATEAEALQMLSPK